MGWGVTAGGSLALATLVDEHGEAILSDLLAYYRVDLRDVFLDKGLSPRYLLALITNLPEDGAFHASRMGGKQFRGWDIGRYALVSLVNAQRAGNYILTVVNSDPKKRKPEPPEPFPTPDSETVKATTRRSNNQFSVVVASMIAAKRQKRELHG